MNPDQILLVATVLAPFVGGLGAFALARSAPGPGAVAAITGSALAFAGAVALVVINAVGEPVGIVSALAGRTELLGLSVDRMAAVLFVLVAGVGTLAQGFASRYLTGDPRYGRFAALCGGAATTTLAAIAAVSIAGLAVAWAFTSVLFCLMLLQRSDLAEARTGAKRSALTFLIADGALVAAALIVLLTGGDVDLRDPAAAAATLDSRQLALPGFEMSVAVAVAILVAICALGRSAQFPLHRWLPSTLASPTPVSAMLHAGFVNGAGLLLILLAPIVALAPAVLWILLALGLVTVALGTLLSLTRPDIKGSLVWSTTAQMGFMVAQCAVGGFAPALFHMVGHGYYKATLFLGSGGAVAARQRESFAPATRAWMSPAGRVAVAILAPAVALAISVTVIAPGITDQRGVSVLLVFAWASAAQATWAWLGHAGGLDARQRIRAAAGLPLVCAAYVGAVAIFDGYVGEALPTVAAAAPSPWLVVAVLFAVAIVAITVRLAAARGGAAARFEQRAWATARDLATAEPVGRPRRKAEPAGQEAPIRQPEAIGVAR